METQAHMEMAHREIQQEEAKEPMEELTEEQFLKNLYLFMKKRDTPIERIPNLGFKQIDLFVMFKVVRDMGGYHQVTAQQLWKQVYNTLGGNPRSTSAATCTRRHYEKLLLPYECHVSGILVNVLPRNQPRHFNYSTYSKEQDDGQRQAKQRKLLPLPQNPHTFQSDIKDSVFPLPPQYPRYYHPSHAVLPPHVPISSSVLTQQSPPAPKPWFPYSPSPLNPTDRVKEPLEQLRFLAEQYKTTTRLTEPLNLSVKASRRETKSNPASSFTPPSSSKNPKFLNKPSPLYAPYHLQAVRNDGCETQDGEAGSGGTPYSYPVNAMEAYVIDVKTGSSSPAHESAPTLRTDEGATAMPQKHSSPKTDPTIGPKEERERSPGVKEPNLSHIQPGLHRKESGGKMEIEVPLSVFHNWLRLCGSSARMHGAKQPPPLPPQGEHSEQRSCPDTDLHPTNLTFHVNPQPRSSAAEDLSLTHKNLHLPSPIPTTQTTGNHHHTRQNHFSTNKPLPSSGMRKNAASHDISPFDIHKSYMSNPSNCWEAYDKETLASPIPVNTDCSPRTVQQNFAASTSYNRDTVQGGKEVSVPSAVLMLNSSSTSLLQLTNEEVMKLKKIISSSF